MTDTQQTMRALTIWQPYAWAIVSADKLAENRSWPPPHSALGERIAIHAGKSVDTMAIQGMRAGLYTDAAKGCPRFSQMVRGAVVGVATLAGWIAPGAGGGSVTDAVTPEFKRECEANRWRAPEQYAWILTDRIELAMPVLCRGYQQLWRLEADVDCQVREQVSAACLRGDQP